MGYAPLALTHPARCWRWHLRTTRTGRHIFIDICPYFGYGGHEGAYIPLDGRQTAYIGFIGDLGEKSGSDMIKQFKTLVDLYRTFSDNQVALDHFKAIRWRNGEFCPYCGNTKVYTLNANRHQCAECRNTFSILVGTIFENTKLPLRVWYGAIWLDQSSQGYRFDHVGARSGNYPKIRLVRFASPASRRAYPIVQLATVRHSRN